MDIGNYGSYRDEPRRVFDWMRLVMPKVILLSAIFGIITRMLLIIITPGKTGLGFLGCMEIFGIGLLNDTAFAIISLAPAVVIYLFLNDFKYKKGIGWLLLLLLAAATAYSFYPGNFFSSYSPWVTRLTRICISIIFICFGIRFFIPAARKPWRAASLTIIEFLYVLAAVVNIICECIYWHKFGVRYNFIAVDRLLYSGNAIKDLFESYPVIPIAIAVFLFSIFITWKMFRRYSVGESSNMGFSNALATVVLYLILAFAGAKWLDFSYRKINSSSLIASEMQGNGGWSWLEACWSGELEYHRFYPSMPTVQAEAMMDTLCKKTTVADSSPMKPMNIIVIALEGIDNEYIDDGLCPFLDSLSRKGISFTNMYASGSSMSKGMDALTLCVPPAPGRSIVNKFDKQSLMRLSAKPSTSDAEGLETTGKLLQGKGYSTAFVYGGNARRGNLRRYFTGNGYEVIEKKNFRKITFANSMGACDDDTYATALSYADKHSDMGIPFHMQILTLSSHSPYSYPSVRTITKPEKEKSIQYADASLRRFMQSAEGKPWFENTLFVITSDTGNENCPKAGLHIDNFHIPAIIYSKGIKPRKVEKLCSQIDLMPTVLSLLNIMPFDSFYGRDILDDSFTERSFVSNYLQLGYLKDSTLTVLQPMRESKSFIVSDGEEIEREMPEESLLKESQAIFQTVSRAFD